MQVKKYVIQATRDEGGWYDFSIQPDRYTAEQLMARYRKNRDWAEYRLVYRIVLDAILEEKP